MAGITDEIAGAPDWMWTTAEQVAAAGLEAVEANRPLCVPGAPNKALVVLARALPRGWALALMDWTMSRRRGRLD
jgi:hypothetical protein